MFMFELNFLLLCNDFGVFGLLAEFIINLIISGFYVNNVSVGSVNVLVMIKVCVYGVNFNDVDIVDVLGIFGVGKDFVCFVINYNGILLNDRYLVLCFLMVDNFKVLDMIVSIFDIIFIVGSLMVVGGIVFVNFDEDGIVYYVVVIDGVGVFSVV